MDEFTEKRIDKNYWVCACVKRKKGLMTAIKMNHNSILKCKKCGCTKESSDKIASQR